MWWRLWEQVEHLTMDALAAHRTYIEIAEFEEGRICYQDIES
jgi:hypothetical protein